MHSSKPRGVNVRLLDSTARDEVARLFVSSFSASEGEHEGQRVGRLALELASDIDNLEIIGLGAYVAGSIAGSIFLTRLQFDEPVRVYMLAPVAVATQHQGQGVGQELIRCGLDELKRRSVDVVVTYGDPDYYTKVGFQPLSETLVKAPMSLSMPHGWLGQSLTGDDIPALEGRPTCVAAFEDPAYW